MKNKLTYAKDNSFSEALKELSAVVEYGEKITKKKLKTSLKKPKVMTAKQIFNLRENKLKVSQAVMAELLGVGLSTYRGWEKGIAKPSGPVFRLLELLKRNGILSIL